MCLPLLPSCGVRADRRSPMCIDSGVVEPFDFRCRRRPTTNFTRPRTRSSNPVPSSSESGELPYCRWLVPISYSIELRLEWPIVKNGGSKRCLYLDVRSSALPLWAVFGAEFFELCPHRHKPALEDTDDLTADLGRRKGDS